MASEDQYAAYLEKISTLITKYGWIVQGVVPADSDDLGFAYTVGLTEAGLPELVISGAWNEQAQQLLNIAARRHCETEIEHGDTVEGIANVPFRAINAPKAEVNFARRLYGRDQVRAIQLVVPDKNRLWPGSPLLAHSRAQELFGPAWW